MAPKKPSGSSPRKFTSSKGSKPGQDSFKVQKRPSPIPAPKSFDLEKIRLMNRLTRSDTIAGTYTPTGNQGQSSGPSNRDEHTSLQVDLSVLGAELDEIVDASHNELQNRIKSGEYSPSLARLSQHLLASPPPSPQSLHSDGSSPKSPNTRARQAEFRKQKFDELIRQDAEFHRLMDDLVGIRQWWKGNRQAWHEKREEVRNIENNLTALIAQAEQSKRRRWGDNVMLSMRFGSSEDFFIDQWTTQIDALTAQKAGLLTWFDENKDLMKIVWTRVKEMEAAVKAEPKEQTTPGMIYSYPPTKDITKLSWYTRQDRGIRWWCGRAVRDLGILEGHLQSLLKSDHDRADQRAKVEHKYKEILKTLQTLVAEEDAEADRQTSVLRDKQPQGYAASIDQILKARYETKLSQARQAFDLQEMINEIETRDFESVVIRKSLNDHITRSKHFRTLLRRIETKDLNIRPPGAENELYFYTDLYNIICTHVSRTRRGLEFGTILDKVKFSQTKRNKMIELADVNSYGYKTEEIFNKMKIALTLKQGRIESTCLNKIGAQFAREALDFTIMVEACQATLDSYEPSLPKTEDSASPATYLVPEIRNITLQKQAPDTPFDLSRGIGSTMTLTVAKRFLEQYPEPELTYTITNALLPWYELLRLFYTAPDTWPLFRNNPSTTRSWSKDEFFTYTNSFLRRPIERNILEAFLVFCSQSNDLFRISEFRRRVETITSGWELVEESNITGLLRKIGPREFPEPRNIERAENALRKYKTALVCNEANRQSKEQDLREFLNRVLPREQRVGREEMRRFVSYWSSVGKFYVLVNQYDPSSLTRIDAGFSIPSTTPYIPIQNPPANFRAIRKRIIGTKMTPLTEKVRDAGVVTERILYDFVFLDGGMVDGAAQGKGMNWVVTRREFHLFLRWCDRERYMFSLKRNGEVGVYPTSPGNDSAPSPASWI